MFQIFEKNFKIFQNSQWVFEWFPILLIIFKTFQVFLPLSTRPFSISSIPTRPPLPADENFLASDHKVISPVHGDSDRIVRWQEGNLGRGFSGFRGKNGFLSKVLTVRRLLNRTLMMFQTEIVDRNVGLEFSTNHSTYNNLKKMEKNVRKYLITCFYQIQLTRFSLDG